MGQSSANELAKAAAEGLDPEFIQTDEGRIVFEALWQNATTEEAQAEGTPDEIIDLIEDQWETEAVQKIIDGSQPGTARPEALQTFARFLVLAEKFAEYEKPAA